MRLKTLTHWIFDMDGTLTIAIHDFAAIKSALGLPHDQPILESLAILHPDEAAQKRRRLDQIELDLAHQAKPALGAGELLEHLRRAGHRLGIVTRNTLASANVTLAATGLSDYFAPRTVLSRECATPKPSPQGVLTLLQQWQAEPTQAAMVGDYCFDLEAGRAAGVTTVLVGEMESPTWQSLCDVHVGDLTHMQRLLIS